MKLEHAEIRVLRLPLLHPSQTSNQINNVPTGAGIGATLNHEFIQRITQSVEVIKP